MLAGIRPDFGNIVYSILGITIAIPKLKRKERLCTINKQQQQQQWQSQQTNNENHPEIQVIPRTHRILSQFALAIVVAVVVVVMVAFFHLRWLLGILHIDIGSNWNGFVDQVVVVESVWLFSHWTDRCYSNHFNNNNRNAILFVVKQFVQIAV